jgi:hypothetical protein
MRRQFLGEWYEVSKEELSEFLRLKREHDTNLVDWEKVDEDLSWHDSGSIAAGACYSTALYAQERSEAAEKKIRKKFKKWNNTTKRIDNVQKSQKRKRAPRQGTGSLPKRKEAGNRR